MVETVAFYSRMFGGFGLFVVQTFVTAQKAALAVEQASLRDSERVVRCGHVRAQVMWRKSPSDSMDVEACPVYPHVVRDSACQSGKRSRDTIHPASVGR